MAQLEAKPVTTPSVSVTTPTTPVTADLDARFGQLEARALAADERAKAQEARIQALEAQVLRLSTAGNQAVAPTPTTQPATTTPVLAVTPAPTAPTSTAPSNLYFGLGGSYPFIPSAGNFDLKNTSFTVLVGIKRLIGGIGLRINADYNLLASKSVQSVSLGGLFTTGDTFYFGLGGGIVFPPPGTNYYLFAGGVAGLYIGGDGFGVFVEADARLEFSTASAFKLGARAGLRIGF